MTFMDLACELSLQDVPRRSYNPKKLEHFLKTWTNPCVYLTDHRIYYKEYSQLKFDIVRSPKQIERWNRLTRMHLQKSGDIYKAKPFKRYIITHT